MTDNSRNDFEIFAFVVGINISMDMIILLKSSAVSPALKIVCRIL